MHDVGHKTGQLLECKGYTYKLHALYKGIMVPFRPIANIKFVYKMYNTMFPQSQILVNA